MLKRAECFGMPPVLFAGLSQWKFPIMKLLLTLLPLIAYSQTGMVPTPDVDIAYWSFGASTQATPIVAVNGGPGLSHVYMIQNDVWPRIAKTRQVILYDQRGTGKSKLHKPDAPQTMEAQVADLDALREHLKFPQIDLVGDSYGGILVMAYTAAHPDRVHKLILSDSAAPAWKNIVHLFPQVFPDIQEAQAKQPKSPDPEQGLRNHFAMIFYSEEKRDAYLANAKDLGSSPQAGAAVRRATAKLDLTPELSKFKCPTLVITGRYDMNVAPLTAWNIHKAIPNSKFIAFEKSGHLPYYEEPDKYVQVINAFLGDSAAPPAAQPPLYGLIGKMTVAPGKRTEVIRLLQQSTAAMPGCQSYIIAEDPADETGIWITEVWRDKTSHDASLSLPEVIKAIAAARPYITGFASQVTTTPISIH